MLQNKIQLCVTLSLSYKNYLHLCNGNQFKWTNSLVCWPSLYHYITYFSYKYLVFYSCIFRCVKLVGCFFTHLCFASFSPTPSLDASFCGFFSLNIVKTLRSIYFLIHPKIASLREVNIAHPPSFIIHQHIFPYKCSAGFHAWCNNKEHCKCSQIYREIKEVEDWEKSNNKTISSKLFIGPR